MGYTSNHENYLDLDMKQTPLSVYTVRTSAGYTTEELSNISWVAEEMLKDAEDGLTALSDENWKEVLKVCGTRAFDYEMD